MKIPLHIAKRLVSLSEGEVLAESSVRHSIIDTLFEENILVKKGRIKKTISLQNNTALNIYLENQYGIKSLLDYIEVLEKEDINRANLVTVSNDSKLKSVRTFKGFLVNCYEPIETKLNNESFIISPKEGSFTFIYDFEYFKLEKNVTVVGIENPENFRNIQKQKYLFNNITPLFVSRYPQNQSKDLIKWLNSIQNPYIHFGDFDIAGIGIFLNEFKKHLNDRASFFIPDNIEYFIQEYGNKKRYDNQKNNFGKIDEDKLTDLIKLIHQYKKGVDQEVFIEL